MTGFIIEKLQTQPALVGTWLPNFEFGEHAKAYTASMQAALNEQAEPVYYILDMSQHDKLKLEHLIEGSNMAAMGSNPNFHHPMTRAVLLITNNVATQAAAKGLRSDTFGNVNAHVFASLDDALVFVQEND